MFTPDGRLLQVEYAGRACTWSSPLVVLSRGSFTILMTCKSSSQTQDRLIVLNDKTVVAMSGILSDSLSLLSVVQRELEKELRLYGRAGTLSSLKIASILGDACQSHAFGGGIRPYGSTMVVCGVDGIYQTDPSGAVVKCMTNDEHLLTVGGSDTRQAQVNLEIKKRILFDKKEDTDLSETLQRLAKILLENDKSDNDSKPQRPKWLEVAVLSPTHGVHRLTYPQIQALLRSIDNDSIKKS